MRPIDADKFIDYIGAGHLRGQFTVCFSERNLVDMINKQPTIEQPKWISCAERLPINEWRTFTEELDWEVYPCLCTVKRTDGIRYVTELFFTGENFVDTEYVRYTEQVTHWMPLPQPPKGG